MDEMLSTPVPRLAVSACSVQGTVFLWGNFAFSGLQWSDLLNSEEQIHYSSLTVSFPHFLFHSGKYCLREPLEMPY